MKLLGNMWKNLLQFRQWNNKEFVEEQLQAHLTEVNGLLSTGDPHLENELIDLAVICLLTVREKYKDKDTTEIENIMAEIEQKRYKKFMLKGRAAQNGQKT